MKAPQTEPTDPIMRGYRNRLAVKQARASLMRKLRRGKASKSWLVGRIKSRYPSMADSVANDIADEVFAGFRFGGGGRFRA